MNTCPNCQRPANAVVHIPDGWNTADYVRRKDNAFEFEPRYTNGSLILRESELLTAGIACYRVQIDKYTVRDYSAA